MIDNAAERRERCLNRSILNKIQYLYDNQIEVINDLTTGGIDDALSAEQGKVLAESIEDAVKTVNNIAPDENGNVEVIVNAPAPLTNITYAELTAAITGSTLTPGTQYRITDYSTTTSQTETLSAGHDFDIIVVADSTNKLNENARAVQRVGDTYFDSSKLEAWRLKYSLDNDTTRFAWADTVEGKGVIYEMIDENNNECPYDFKNIMFKRALTGGNYDPDSGTDTWVYTFTWVDGNLDIQDLSIVWKTLTDDVGKLRGIYGNKILSCLSYGYINSASIYALNDNVFISNYSYNAGLFYGCYSNTLGNNCYSNTFGNECYSNTLGNYCSSITFGNECYSNTLGNNCYSNTFGNYCSSITFGNNCNSNTFGDECSSNILGNYCSSNTFGDECSSNILGNYCNSNTFGNFCSSNTFGNNYQNNQIGDSLTNVIVFTPEQLELLKGDKGDTGAQGIQGEKGDKGDTGAQGIQGIKGDKGDTGAQGIQGLQGEKGDKGDTGLQGIQGIQGIQGDKGDKGDKGDIGLTGATGKSAYQSYVDTTTDTPPLTEQQWTTYKAISNETLTLIYAGL